MPRRPSSAVVVGLPVEVEEDLLEVGGLRDEVEDPVPRRAPSRARPSRSRARTGAGPGPLPRRPGRRRARGAHRGRPARRRSPSRAGATARAGVSTASTSTRRPERMIPTRSAACCTSSSECEERNTVRPSAAVSRRRRPHLGLQQRVEACRRLVEHDEVGAVHERLHETRPSGGSRARAAGSAGRVRRRAARRARRGTPWPGPRAAARASRAPLARSGGPTAAGRRAGTRRDCGPRRRPCACRSRRRLRARTWGGEGRGGGGSSWTSRRRSGRDSRTPRRTPPAGRGPRARARRRRTSSRARRSRSRGRRPCRRS